MTEKAMPRRPTFKEYLKLWFKHFKDPFTTVIWLFFRPYRYRWAWRKLQDELKKKQLELSQWQALFLPLLESVIVIISLLVTLYFLQAGFEFLSFINLKKFASVALFSIVGGVVFGVALGAAEDVPLGVAGGVAFSVAFSAVFGMAMSVVWFAVKDVASFVAFGVAAGVVFGVAVSVAVGVAWGVAEGVAWGLIGGVVLGVAWSVELGMAWSAAFALSIAIIIARFFDQIAWSLASQIALLSGKKTPLSKFNEYIVFPIFGDYKLLYRKLKANFAEGLDEGFEIAYNPFQRWIFQRGLKRYMSELTPSELLRTFRNIRLEFERGFWSLPVIPANRKKFTEKEISRLQGVLILLSLKNPKDFKGAERNPFNFVPEESELWAIRLTFPLMDRSDSLITDLATAYHAMIFENERPKNYLYAFNRAKIEGSKFADELGWTYRTINECLNVKKLSDITKLIPKLEKFEGFRPPFQPEVIKAFGILCDIAVDARAMHFATARLARQEASGSALGKLEELKSYADKELPEPERRYFMEIAEFWRKIITERAYEEIKRVKLEAVANPYPVGPPVTGYAFKGRDDVFTKITALWNKEQRSFVPILLYGHRRMGKTSIAKNLTEKHIGSDYIPIYASAQGQSGSETVILRYIARVFSDQMKIDIPPFQSFEKLPRSAFNEVLWAAEKNRNGKIVIMVIDEFEAIEEAIKNGKIPQDFIDYLRSISQEHSEWLGLMLVGSHRLEELTHEYWNPLFASIQPIKVGFMSENAAWELITNPTPDFGVNYKPEVVERIIQLTGGQPFLINKICSAIINELNRRIKAGGYTGYPTIDSEFLKIALNEVAPDRTNYYFHAVWNQISPDERQVARIIKELMLKKMKISPEKLLEMASNTKSKGIRQPCVKFDEVLDALGWDAERLENTLHELTIHDVIKPTGDECSPLKCRKILLAKDEPFPKNSCLCFCVPLMVVWFTLTKI